MKKAVNVLQWMLTYSDVVPDLSSGGSFLPEREIRDVISSTVFQDHQIGETDPLELKTYLVQMASSRFEKSFKSVRNQD
ncbi:hypothetical protein CapIbe_008425 [Capra ibex]